MDKKTARLRFLAQQSNVPVRFGLKLLDELKDPLPSLGKLLRDWAQHREEYTELTGRGVFLSGPPGCGHSEQAVSTLLSNMLWNGATGLYISCPEFVEMEKRSFSGDGPGEYADLPFHRGEATTRELLVLDNIGSEHRTVTQFAVDLIKHLLLVRANKGLPTIAVTTMQDGPSWESTYGADITALVEENFDPVFYKPVMFRGWSGEDDGEFGATRHAAW
ncbi:hypothetical protein [Streptomyces sp. NBC_00470]|uniref:ATP-binding protein n=1 Tax=Streptomyces sp. NBC_00470 TaxID=2975753 RepID=UPI0030E39050